MVLGAALGIFGWGCGAPTGSPPDGSAVGTGETGGATGAGGSAEATATGGATGSGGSDLDSTGGAPGTGGVTGAAGSGAGGATGVAGSGAGGTAEGGANGSGGALGGGTGGALEAGAGGSAGVAGGLGGVHGGAGGSAGVAGNSTTCRPQPAETEWSPIAAIGNGVGEPLPIFAVADDDVFVAELTTGIQRWRNGQLMLELPAQNVVRDVWGTSGTDVWTVGSGVWHRNSIGWTEVPTPVTVPGGAAPGLSLNTVWGRAADDVYIGGNQGILMHWDGAAWTRLPAPLPTIPDRATIVTGVFASGASDIWIIGTFTGSGAPANLQHWDGQTWTIYTRTAGAWTAGSTGTVPRQPPSAIWGSGPHDVWIVGGAEMGGVVHYDGVSWTDMPPPALPADAGLVDITGACASDVWVVGARVTGFDPVTLGDTFEGLVYHFDGAHWTPSIAAPDDLLRGVAVSPGRVWITGGHTLYGSPR